MDRVYLFNYCIRTVLIVGCPPYLTPIPRNSPVKVQNRPKTAVSPGSGDFRLPSQGVPLVFILCVKRFLKCYLDRSNRGAHAFYAPPVEYTIYFLLFH